jgi:hypothetical protein
MSKPFTLYGVTLPEESDFTTMETIQHMCAASPTSFKAETVSIGLDHAVVLEQLPSKDGTFAHVLLKLQNPTFEDRPYTTHVREFGNKEGTIKPHFWGGHYDLDLRQALADLYYRSTGLDPFVAFDFCEDEEFEKILEPLGDKEYPYADSYT